MGLTKQVLRGMAAVSAAGVAFAAGWVFADAPAASTTTAQGGPTAPAAQPSAPTQTQTKGPTAAPAKPALPSKLTLLLPKDVDLKVKVIHARRSGKFIDPRVRRVEKLLKPLLNFSSFRLVHENKMRLTPNTETKLPMPFRVAVRVTQRGLLGKKVSLNVQVGRKQAVKLLLDDGGTYLQGITLKNGQSYILVITVKSV
jgi:hypothetical protein